jgi:hypothetical protein
MAGCSSSAKGSSAKRATSTTAASSSPNASTTTSSTGSATTTTLPRFTGVASSRFCALDAQLHASSDLAFANAATTPLATLRASYSGAMARVAQMVQAASPEIKGAIAALGDALRRVQPAMDRAHYNSSNLDAADKAIIAGPDIVSATNRLGAYETQVCKRAS